MTSLKHLMALRRGNRCQRNPLEKGRSADEWGGRQHERERKGKVVAERCTGFKVFPWRQGVVYSEEKLREELPPGGEDMGNEEGNSLNGGGMGAGQGRDFRMPTFPGHAEWGKRQ